MWGAVVGDIAGSRFEGSRGDPKDFQLFHRLCAYTDDTVCTAAIADIILNDRKPAATLQAWCRRHPGRGYGGFFREWIGSAVPRPYGSFGNGAAMRVSPVALLYREQPLEDALAASDRVTKITHDHPEGIKGARAVAEAIWRALRGEGPETVRREITARYSYGLEPSVEDIRPSHRFDVTCQGRCRRRSCVRSSHPSHVRSTLPMSTAYPAHENVTSPFEPLLRQAAQPARGD